MTELRRPIYKHAVLAHASASSTQSQYHDDRVDANHVISTYQKAKRTPLVAGLGVVGLLHLGVYGLTQLDQPVESPKKALNPVVVEILKPEPIKPKIIEPEIPPIVQEPKPKPIVNEVKPEPIKQKSEAKPVVTKQPAPVLTAKADAPTTNPVVVPVAEPVATPVEPKQEDLPVTEAKGYAGYLSNPAPEYPEVAFDRGWEGRVVLRILVSANGSPIEINVKQSSGKKVLDDAAQRTVKRWKFAPATRGSTPIEGWVDVPIDFKLPK